MPETTEAQLAATPEAEAAAQELEATAEAEGPGSSPNAETAEADSDKEGTGQGIDCCASQFICSLLADAVEEYTDEAVREIVFSSDAMLVLSEAEAPILEVDDEDTESLLNEDCGLRAAAVPAEVPLSQVATDMDEADSQEEEFLFECLEEDMSVVSYAGDQGFDLEEEEEIAAVTLAELIVRAPFETLATSEPAPEVILSAAKAVVDPLDASKLEPCTRRTFRRRLAPRPLGAPVPEEPFPCDCLPPSRPVAREVPPAAEIARLASEDCSAQVEKEAPQPLSQEAGEQFCSIASAAFAALRLMASEEASTSIQRHWKEYKARQVLAKSKAMVASTSPSIAMSEAESLREKARQMLLSATQDGSLSTAFAAGTSDEATDAGPTLVEQPKQVVEGLREKACQVIMDAMEDGSLLSVLEGVKKDVAAADAGRAVEKTVLEVALPAASAPQVPRCSPSNPRRRLRVADTGAAVPPPAEAEAPAPPELVAPGAVEPPRPPTAPPTARPHRPGSRPTGNIGSTAPSVAMPAPPATAPAGVNRPSSRPASTGFAKALAAPEVGLVEGAKAPRTPRQHHLRMPEAPKSARAQTSMAPSADASWAAGLFGEGSTWAPAAPTSPASRGLTSASGAFRRQKASHSNPPGAASSSASGEAVAATPRSSGPSAMEMDLGFGPTAPSPRMFVLESPRMKSSGTGLLPALHGAKAGKTTAAGSVGWTIDSTGSLSARGGSLTARSRSKCIDGTSSLF